MWPLQRSRGVLQNRPSGGDCAGEKGEEICHLTSAKKALQPGTEPLIPYRGFLSGQLSFSNLPSPL